MSTSINMQSVIEDLDILNLLILSELKNLKNPTSTYQIFKQINKRLNLINIKIPPGGFYYRINKLIKFNLIKQKGEVDLNHQEKEIYFHSKNEINFNQVIKKLLHSPTFWDCQFLYIALIIIKLEKIESLLMAVIDFCKIELIKINQTTFSDKKEKRQVFGDNNIINNIWQKNYLEFAIKVLTEYSR